MGTEPLGAIKVSESPQVGMGVNEMDVSKKICGDSVAAFKGGNHDLGNRIMIVGVA
jgi:hypothetical protein